MVEAQCPIRAERVAMEFRILQVLQCAARADHGPDECAIVVQEQWRAEQQPATRLQTAGELRQAALKVGDVLQNVKAADTAKSFFWKSKCRQIFVPNAGGVASTGGGAVAQELAADEVGDACLQRLEERRNLFRHVDPAA